MSEFDDIIKGKANNHQAQVPADAWQNIVNKKRKRRFGFVWWMAGLLLICSGVAIYKYSGKQTGNNKEETAFVTTIKKETVGKIAEKNNYATDKKTGGNPSNSSTAQVNILSEETVPASTNGSKQTSTNKNTNNTLRPIKNKNIIHTQTNTAAVNRKNLLVQKKKIHKEDIATALAANSKTSKRTKGKMGIATKGADPEGAIALSQQKMIEKAVDELIGTEKTVAITEEKILPITKTVVGGTDTTTATQQKNIGAIALPKENKKNSLTNKKQSKKYPWFIEASAAPTLAVQQYEQPIGLSRTLSSSISLTVFSAKSVSTEVQPAVAFSLAIKKSVASKLVIGIGLQYLQLKENSSISGNEKITTYSIVNRLVTDASGSRLVPDTIQNSTEGSRKINATNSYRFFSVPLFVEYSFVQRPSWSLGAVAGFYLHVSSAYQNEIDKNATAILMQANGSANNKNNFGTDLFVSLRLGKMLGKKIEFFAMPSLRLNLNRPSINNSLVNRSTNQAGLNLGLSFRLN